MAKKMFGKNCQDEIYKSSSFLNDSKKKTFLYRDVTLYRDRIIISCVSNIGYISVITKSGKELYRIGTDHIRSPYGVCVSLDCVYVTDLFSHCLLRYSISGELIARTGKRSKSPGDFNLPYGLTVDRSGIVYVTDNRNHRIQAFTADLELITSFGRNIFHRPSDVQSCRDGSLVVLDNSGRRLHKLSPDIYPVRSVNTDLALVATHLKTLYFPLFFCLDPAENILISDRYSRCIQLFDSNLVHKSSFTGSPFDFDPKGIVCDETRVVTCLSDSGPFLRTFKAT